MIGGYSAEPGRLTPAMLLVVSAAAQGERPKQTAARTGRSVSTIMKIRAAATQRAGAVTIEQTVYIVTRRGELD